MRHVFAGLFYLFIFAALLTSGLFALCYRDYEGPGPLSESRIVAIEKGSGVTAIAGTLANEGVIGNPLLFKVAARLSGQHTKLHAGEYDFPAHISLRDVLDMMAKGSVYHRFLTIPEGLTSWQVVQILNEMPELTGTIDTIPPEGSLLPETYSYMRGDARQAKLDEMREAMKKTLADLIANKTANAPDLKENEIVTLASIVEKETGVPEERRRIAGVFVNRLEKGMPLQTDPTVIYALTEGKIQQNGQGPLGRRLLRKDLAFESPYNTYLHPGLPPGPIANPGRAALEAALNPEENDFLYFVADGTGGHVFSHTLAEHNRNAAQWRKIRKSRGE